MNSREDKRRLFVALWPSLGLAEKMVDLSVKTIGDGRPVPAEKLHVTLQFLGDAPVSRVADICLALDRISSSSFDLHLDRFGYWRRTRVVWLGSSRPCEALNELVSSVAAELRLVDFKPERRPFRGHLTLARNCRRPGDLRPPGPLRWAVRQCSLVASTLTAHGARYRELHSRTLP